MKPWLLLVLAAATGCSSPHGARAVLTPHAPQPIGPYSQAIARGPFVFVSGQIGLDPATGELVPGDIATQSERALENLRAVLAAESLDFEHVVSVNVYLVDLAEFGAFNTAYARAFGTWAPARATVEVSGLPKGARVEIQCTAMRP